MYRYQMAVYYKNEPNTPNYNDLLKGSKLQAGDRFTRIFEGPIDFRKSSDEDALKAVFATFNGQGDPLPTTAPSLPRSLSVGDIICGESIAFLITETGFQRLAFRPREAHFIVTEEILARQLPTARSAKD